VVPSLANQNLAISGDNANDHFELLKHER